MAAQPRQSTEEGDDSPILSPFAQTTSSVRPAQAPRRAPWALWLVSAGLALIVLGNAAYFTLRYLEPVPIAGYLWAGAEDIC